MKPSECGFNHYGGTKKSERFCPNWITSGECEVDICPDTCPLVKLEQLYKELYNQRELIITNPGS